MAVIDFKIHLARLHSIAMEDFECMATIRFPELKKCYQRLNCETFGKLKLNNYEVLDFFEKMLKNSVACDEPEEIPISAFTDLFLCLMEKYFRLEDLEEDPSYYSLETFRLLFETLDTLQKLTPEYCVKFLTLCKDALNWNTEHFLIFLSEREVKLILDSFVNQRFHGWDLKNGNVLTMWMEVEEDHHFCEKLFIRYGFEYNFDYHHFGILLMFMEKMWVDGVRFSHYLDQEILFKTGENLRIQLAFELLVALFINEENRNALSMLWKSLPYAFITSNELYNLLKPCIIERYDLLESLCDKYEKTVHKICPVPKVSEPRSLKHLSRVQVRKSLIEVHNLNEETIRELDIPVTLKDYLWLDDF